MDRQQESRRNDTAAGSTSSRQQHRQDTVDRHRDTRSRAGARNDSSGRHNERSGSRHGRERHGDRERDRDRGHRERGSPERTQHSRVRRARSSRSPAAAAEGAVPHAPVPDPALDFLSPEFDALKALLTPGLQPPNTKVMPLDNITRCRPLLPPDDPESAAARRAAKQPLSEEEAAEAAAKRERDQARREEVRARRNAEKAQPPALETVMGFVPAGGPLGLLRRCYESRVKVRVVTRHRRGVRGVAVGTLLGFDKHMNLLLADVEEQYSVRLRIERVKVVGVDSQGRRARSSSAAADGGGGEGGSASTEQQQAAARAKPSGWMRADPVRAGKAKRGKVERSKLAWKQEHRRRHLRQALLRGDSVVMVSAVLPDLPLAEKAAGAYGVLSAVGKEPEGGLAKQQQPDEYVPLEGA